VYGFVIVQEQQRGRLDDFNGFKGDFCEEEGDITVMESRIAFTWLDMAFDRSGIWWNHTIQAEADRRNFGNGAGPQNWWVKILSMGLGRRWLRALGHEDCSRDIISRICAIHHHISPPAKD